MAQYYSSHSTSTLTPSEPTLSPFIQGMSPQIKSHINPIENIIGEMNSKLRRREVIQSVNIAIEMIKLFRNIVSLTHHSTINHLMNEIREIGKNLTRSAPFHLVIGNITRRVLRIIRQEHMDLVSELSKKNAANTQNHTSTKSQDLQNIPTHNLDEKIDFLTSPNLTDNLDLNLCLSKTLDLPLEDIASTLEYNPSSQISSTLRSNILEEINDFLDEVKNIYSHISEQAIEHIHSNEVIMTYSHSQLVLEFFKEAAKFRAFDVIVMDSAPGFEGHYMAEKLSNCHVNCTLITDAAVFSLMSRVNKVIIGTHAVLANGGALALTGANNLAVSAYYYGVPFIVLCGMYQISPEYAFDQDSFQEMGNPNDIMSFSRGDIIGLFKVINPTFDYIQPDYISLLLTNFGGHNPSYVYRLLTEYYCHDDYIL